MHLNERVVDRAPERPFHRRLVRDPAGRNAPSPTRPSARRPARPTVEQRWRQAFWPHSVRSLRSIRPPAPASSFPLGPERTRCRSRPPTHPLFLHMPPPRRPGSRPHLQLRLLLADPAGSPRRVGKRLSHLVVLSANATARHATVIRLRIGISCKACIAIRSVLSIVARGTSQVRGVRQRAIIG